MKITAFITVFPWRVGADFAYFIDQEPNHRIPPGARQYRAVWDVPDPIALEALPSPKMEDVGPSAEAAAILENMP